MHSQHAGMPRRDRCSLDAYRMGGSSGPHRMRPPRSGPTLWSPWWRGLYLALAHGLRAAAHRNPTRPQARRTRRRSGQRQRVPARLCRRRAHAPRPSSPHRSQGCRRRTRGQRRARLRGRHGPRRQTACERRCRAAWGTAQARTLALATFAPAEARPPAP
eukprot:scaffold253993_cov37-Tisochrysis_lutea.AAC.3